MFSDILKELRAKKGLSQVQLAKAVGVSPGNVGDWEGGKTKPGYSALSSLARFFEVSADDLLELKALEITSSKQSRFQIYCDGVALTETEADLIAMYRLIPDADRKTVFDLTKLKYEQSTGEKVSIYSTYTDANERRENVESSPGENNKTGFGIA